ncbi:MAG: DUF3696 domain-containing protein [bacterium]
MITKINVEGFKLHAKTSINAKPITIFIGPNNSGKSSLIQAVQSLCQTTNSNIFIPHIRRLPEKSAYLYPCNTYKIDPGRFEDVLKKGSEYICIALAGKTSGRVLSEKNKIMEVEFEVKIKDNYLLSHKGRVKDYYWWDYNIGNSQAQNVCKGVHPTGNFQLVDKLKCDNDNFPMNLLESCYFIYPIRGFEEAGYLLPEEPSQRYSTLENITLNDRVVTLIAAFAYNADLRKEVAQKLSQIMGYGIDIDIQWIGSNRVKILLKEPVNTPIVNEGSGFQQMIFIVLPLILIPDNSTVFIQEPEVHLHPKAQVEIGRLLIKFVENKNSQLFIETHSEHILHAFLYAIATQQISKDDLAIYYFENKEWSAKVTALEIDELGRVKDGFPGFFEQSLEELTEFLDAIKRREK